MPIIEQMISRGSGPANSWTKSAVPDGLRSIIRSRISAALARTDASSSVT